MPLTLNDILSVTVDTASLAASARSFETGLIIAEAGDGSETPTLYDGLEGVLAAGFTTDTEAYQAAALYFGQSPQPRRLALMSRQSGETALEAVTRAREAAVDWYGFTFTREVEEALESSEILAIAAYIEGSGIPSVWFHLVPETEGAAAACGALAERHYERVMSIVSGDSLTASAGVLGLAMGLNRDASPAFTLAYKSIPGLPPEAGITANELTAILAARGNVYVRQGGKYDLFRQGKMAGGYAFDDVLLLDMLVEGLKTSVMAALTAEKKIPLTDAGMQVLISALSAPCEDMLARGYLSPGVWNRADVLTLLRGDTLPRGYRIMADSVDSRPQTERDARQAPPIYVCVKTAGAVEYLRVALTVNR